MIPLRDNIPTDRLPLVTLAIIVISVAVFVLFQGPSLSGVEPRPVVEYGAIPYRVAHPGRDCDVGVVRSGSVAHEQVVCEGTPEYEAASQREELEQAPVLVTLFASMFMHGGWLHIIFNMLFLWIFGNNVEDSMGRMRFIVFYLLGGLVAMGAQVAVNPDSTVPTVGASGAIAAVLGGYMLLYPRARVLTVVFIIFFFTFVEIPAVIMLGIWLALQFLPAVGQLASPEVGDGGGVAYFAHIGGFLFGLALISLFAKRKSRHYGRPRYPVY